MRLELTEEHLTALGGLAALIISTTTGIYWKLQKTFRQAEGANNAVNNTKGKPLVEMVLDLRDSHVKLGTSFDEFVKRYERGEERQKERHNQLSQMIERAISNKGPG